MDVMVCGVHISPNLCLIVTIISFILILNDLGDYLWGWREYEFTVDNNLATIMYVNVDLVVNMPCHCKLHILPG
jgi:hypothetical protein